MKHITINGYRKIFPHYKLAKLFSPNEEQTFTLIQSE